MFPFSLRENTTFQLCPNTYIMTSYPTIRKQRDADTFVLTSLSLLQTAFSLATSASLLPSSFWHIFTSAGAISFSWDSDQRAAPSPASCTCVHISFVSVDRLRRLPVRSSQVRSGLVLARSGRVGLDQARSDQVWSGQVWSDRVRSGQVRASCVRQATVTV